MTILIVRYCPRCGADGVDRIEVNQCMACGLVFAVTNCGEVERDTDNLR